MRKATDKQIVDSYEKTGNIWKAAEELGMCGQSVQERLVKLGIKRKNPHMTIAEAEEINDLYQTDFLAGNELKKLSNKLGRTEQWISRKARDMGLTDSHRQRSEPVKRGISTRNKEWFKNNEHPRGYLGHKHGPETRKRLAEVSRNYFKNETASMRSGRIKKMMETKIERGNLVPQRHKVSWKSGWHEIGGKKIYLRSQWEVEYAHYLEFLKKGKQIIGWEYEPDVFWFEKIRRGVRSYTPDFKITNNDGTIEYHEVKGWMDDRSKTKIKRMAKYHPEVRLLVIARKELKDLGLI